jgi:hypothetical protein
VELLEPVEPIGYDLLSLSTERKYRPVERYWPYVEKPEEPTAEELAALDPDLHTTLFGPRELPFSITLVFPPFEGGNFDKALAKAKGVPGIHRDRRRRQPPLSRAVFLERRAAAARSLRARRTRAWHRGADR